MTKYDVLCLYKTKDITMDILKHMVDLASGCGYVTVNQYLEMSGIDDCSEGGNEWGWYAKTIMDTVGVKTRCGWILDLGDPCLVTEKPKNGRYSWPYTEESSDIAVKYDLCYCKYMRRGTKENRLVLSNGDQCENIPNNQSEKNVHPHKSGKYPFGYDPNTEPAILIDHAEESIQNYIKYGNLHNLKAVRDILTTAIVKLEDEESEEK